MTFLDFEIDEKDLASAKFIGETRRKLAAALLEAKKDDPNICQAQIARVIDMDKGSLSKILNGHGNMTLRTIAEISWALGLLPEIQYVPLNEPAGSGNHHHKLFGRHGAAHKAALWSHSQPSPVRVKVNTSVQSFGLEDAR